jgi:hypothetical protein
MEASWTLNDAWAEYQRLELENDLIAAYILETGVLPPAQFSARGATDEAR